MKNQIVIITGAGFIALTLIGYVLFFLAFRRALLKSSFPQERKSKIFNRSVVILGAWALAISALALGGVFLDFTTPPKLIFVLVITAMGVVWITFSKTTKEILSLVPPQTIIRLQSFRIAVEILLWALFTQLQLPVQMTFEGRNFDILAGLTAPVIAYFCFVRKSWPYAIAIGWNIMCLGLLVNIVAIAILSMPTPLRLFINEPANTIVAQFPFIWLPAFLVPLAYGLHFLSLRQLMGLKKDLPSLSW